MNHEELQHYLDALKTPASINSAHKRRLKRALVRAASSSGFKNVFLTLHSMSLAKKLVPLGVIVIVGAAVIANVLPSSFTPPVNARELVNQSLDRAVTIPVETRKEIEKHIDADMEETLEEAKRAPDLKIITKAEFEREDTKETKNGAFKIYLEKVSADALQSLTYLRYTNPEGRKVTLGLNKHEVLVFKLVEITDEEAREIEKEAKNNSDIPGGPVRVEIPTK